MELTVDDLTDDERLAYWNAVEIHARKSRTNLVRLASLSKRMARADVSDAAQTEVLDKERSANDADLGSAPTPDDVRAARTVGR